MTSSLLGYWSFLAKVYTYKIDYTAGNLASSNQWNLKRFALVWTLSIYIFYERKKNTEKIKLG